MKLIRLSFLYILHQYLCYWKYDFKTTVLCSLCLSLFEALKNIMITMHCQWKTFCSSRHSSWLYENFAEASISTIVNEWHDFCYNIQMIRFIYSTTYAINTDNLIDRLSKIFNINIWQKILIMLQNIQILWFHYLFTMKI